MAGTITVENVDVSTDSETDDLGTNREGLPCYPYSEVKADAILTVTDDSDDVVAKTTLGTPTTQVTASFTDEDAAEFEDESIVGDSTFGNCVFPFTFEYRPNTSGLFIQVADYPEIAVTKEQLSTQQVDLSVSEDS